MCNCGVRHVLRCTPAGILGHGDAQTDEPQPKLVRATSAEIINLLHQKMTYSQVLALHHIKSFSGRGVKDAQVQAA
jgi:hypothetical protein